MSQVTLYSAQLIEDRTVELPRSLVDDSNSLGEVAAHLIGKHDREHLLALFLDVHAHVVGINIVSIGHASGTLTTPKETLRAAIISGAPAFALAHNHPSGDLHPSKEDIQFTQKISELSRLLGLVLLDHVIVHQNRHRSISNECFDCF